MELLCGSKIWIWLTRSLWLSWRNRLPILSIEFEWLLCDLIFLIQILLCPALSIGEFDLRGQVCIVSFKLINTFKLARRGRNYRSFVGNALLQVLAKAQLSLLQFHRLPHSILLLLWYFHSLFLFLFYSQLLKYACLLHVCGSFEESASLGSNFVRFLRSEAFLNRLFSRVHCLCMLVVLSFYAWHDLLARLLSRDVDCIPKGGHGVHFLILHQHVIIPPRVLRSCRGRVWLTIKTAVWCPAGLRRVDSKAVLLDSFDHTDNFYTICPMMHFIVCPRLHKLWIIFLLCVA